MREKIQKIAGFKREPLMLNDDELFKNINREVLKAKKEIYLKIFLSNQPPVFLVFLGRFDSGQKFGNDCSDEFHNNRN